MLAQPPDVSGKHRRSAALPASPANHSDKLLDPLQRLPRTAGQLGEDRTLGVGQRLAHGPNEQGAPSVPAVASKHAAEELWVSQRLAQHHLRLHGGPAFPSPTSEAT